MASRSRIRAENVPGELFVDESCIDCDACRWMAPETFDRSGDQSRVHRQPETPRERRRALQALLACPTGSIGTRTKVSLAGVRASFPDRIDGEVYHCGYHHRDSFGATSYLVRRAEGNVLVDSPRFTGALVRRLEELGGVRTMFLTHRDDVGDHARFREHFGCERVLHARDAVGELRRVERRIEGRAPVELAPELLAIPVPGHTAGSACLLVGGTYLFSGDHVAWSERLGRVYAFRSACWFDWEEQIESMRALGEHDFEWILPGHGRRCRFARERMRAEMKGVVAWMEARR
jgi:glyoxylase-like metal-dependent hydrolase (beta-lactamase superfamily II)